MAARAGLINGILADLQDDAPRLVFADLLADEAPRLGNAAADALLARGELIRVQCRLARLAEDDPARTELATRERLLLGTYAAVWAEGLGHPVAGYRRGLAYLGVLNPTELGRLPAALFEREPVEVDLDLRSGGFGGDALGAALPGVDELAAAPRLRSVRAITPRRDAVDEAFGRRLLRPADALTATGQPERLFGIFQVESVGVFAGIGRRAVADIGLNN